jgi:hypothetical protein
MCVAVWTQVAAGSCAFGFWFELPGNPNGPSFTTSICPNNDHLGEFFNNTAHSCNSHGLRGALVAVHRVCSRRAIARSTAR